MTMNGQGQAPTTSEIEKLAAEYYERLTRYGYTGQEYRVANNGGDVFAWRVSQILAELSAAASPPKPIKSKGSKK